MRHRRFWFLLVVVCLIGSNAGRAEELAFAEVRVSLLEPKAAEPFFWFSPGAWSDRQLRSATLNIESFDPEGDLVDALLHDPPEELPTERLRVGHATHRLVALPGVGKRQSSTRAHTPKPRLRLLKPRLRIRAIPRVPLTPRPAEVKPPKRVQASQ